VAQVNARRETRAQIACAAQIAAGEEPVDPHSAVGLAHALAALQKSTDKLRQREQDLEQLNRRFDIALNNMGRGLSMFDGAQRMIVCNRLYLEIYGLPRRLARAGTPLSRIMRSHVRHETGRDDPQAIRDQCRWLEEHVLKMTRGETFSYTQRLKNGRIVQVTTHPLVGGGWVDIQEDVTERRRAEQKIAWLAHHDPLTNTANRVYFGEALRHALGQLASGGGFALHWIDLDYFKQVNDDLGHPAGDTLLKSVATHLCRSVRAHDLVARLGGDEFAVIQATATTPTEACELSARLLAAVNGPHEVCGTKVSIGASIGIVLAPEHGTNADELMKNVDVALYRAKDAGRGTITIF
jgi:diguanylate cyclase (GGDEF)-like protein